MDRELEIAMRRRFDEAALRMWERVRDREPGTVLGVRELIEMDLEFEEQEAVRYGDHDYETRQYLRGVWLSLLNDHCLILTNDGRLELGEKPLWRVDDFIATLDEVEQLGAERDLRAARERDERRRQEGLRGRLSGLADPSRTTAGHEAGASPEQSLSEL